MESKILSCEYIDSQGQRCDGDRTHGAVCYWHDSSGCKKGPDVKVALQKWAKSGKSMAGFSLRKADLSGINLVNTGSKQGFNFSEADLYHADISDSHLFGIDFTNTSLMKANLNGSNLHCANLSDANLLGTTLHNAKLENVSWGTTIIQEKKAGGVNQTLNKATILLYEEAEEVYRNLRLASEKQGLFEIAGTFFQREMIMRRMQMPLYSLKRLISKSVDLFCAYGENPARIILFSLLLVFIFAFGYAFLGIESDEGIIICSTNNSLVENLIVFYDSIYFSVITFTTLGYGDLIPTGYTRALSAIEAFGGSFTLALFVVVFVKKMTR